MKHWKEKIDESLKEQEQWKQNFKVDVARAYFEGKQKPEWIRDQEWITVNKVYSHLVSQLPAMYSLDPYFYVKLARTKGADPQRAAEWQVKGKIRQAYLNYMKKKLKLKDKARLGIQDAHFAFGCMKTIYDADLIENEKYGEQITDDDGTALFDDDGNPLEQPEFMPSSGKYCLKRIHPDNIIFGCDSGVLADEWPWLAERVKMPVYKAKKDKRLNQKVLKRIIEKAKRLDKNLDHESTILEFWEVWDIDNQQMFMIHKDCEDPLIKPSPTPKGIDGHPYSFLRFTLRDNSPYPIPPLSQGIDPQREYNEARSKVLVHRKRFNRKYEVNVNALEDPDFELQKLETGEDGTVIRKMTGDQAVSTISDGPLDQMNYSEIAMLNGDMIELFGSSDAARGVAASDSATEAGIIDQRQNIKEGDKLSMVVDWLVDIAKKLDYLVQVYIDGEEAVNIIGPEGESWEVVRPEDYEEIHGDYDFSVNVGSTQPRLPGIERAQWIAFMSQVVIPMPAILTKPNLMKKLSEMFGIEDESMIEEMRELGETVMNQQGAGVNPQGSQAGIPQENPVGAILGQANGLLGGNVNGGGNGEM